MFAASDWLPYGLAFAGIVTVALPLGHHLLAVLDPEIAGGTFLEGILGPIERLIYRAMRIGQKREQSRRSYACCLLLSGAATAGVVFWPPSFRRGVLLLPFAITAWAGLVRHAGRPRGSTIGLFWRDVVRLALYLFLPASLLIAPFLLISGLASTALQLATAGKAPFGIAPADLLQSILVVGFAAGLADYLGRMVGEHASRWMLWAVMSVILTIEIQQAGASGVALAALPLSRLWPLTPLPVALLGTIVRKRVTG